MTENPLGLLWTESHRPKRLEDLALEDETRRVLESYLAAGEIPHLLLLGPPGSGKTTLARILYKALDCRHLVLNASSERGIDTVRDKIGSFVTASFGVRWNIIFLDEFDAMTTDAQTALRNMIEAHADRSRFILSGNYGHKIIGPIQSRCQLLTLGRPPLKERYRILTTVLEAEGITAEPKTVLGYADRYPDLRKMLMSAQRASLAAGNGALPPATEEDRAGGDEVLVLIKARNWAALRRLTASGGFDPAQGLRDLFWAIPDNDDYVGFLRHVVGRGVHESSYTVDPVILFLAVAAECMEGMK